MFIVYALNFDCCRYVGEASSHHFDFLKRGSFFLVPSDLLQYQNGQLPPQMDMTSRNIQAITLVSNLPTMDQTKI